MRILWTFCRAEKQLVHSLHWRGLWTHCTKRQLHQGVAAIATVTIGSGTTYRALAEILLGLLERHLEFVWTETG